MLFISYHKPQDHVGRRRANAVRFVDGSGDLESAPLVKKKLMLAHSVPIPKGISANWKAGPGEDGKDGEIM